MKAQVILPLSVVVSVVSFALLKVRLKEVAEEEKKLKFQGVKLQMTDDVLLEYGNEKERLESEIVKGKDEQTELGKALAGMKTVMVKIELDECTEAKEIAMNDTSAILLEQEAFKDAATKEKAAWEEEITSLKNKLQSVSPICNFLKPGASIQDICPEKKEEPKAEPPKAEEKKEPPKAEEKKEPPKAEEKKEPPKGEEKKEPPKAEKKEPPKPEGPKQEAPKGEANKL